MNLVRQGGSSHLSVSASLISRPSLCLCSACSPARMLPFHLSSSVFHPYHSPTVAPSTDDDKPASTLPRWESHFLRLIDCIFFLLQKEKNKGQPCQDGGRRALDVSSLPLPSLRDVTLSLFLCICDLRARKFSQSHRNTGHRTVFLSPSPHAAALPWNERSVPRSLASP